MNKKKVLVLTTTYPMFLAGDATPPFVHELTKRLVNEELEIIILTPRRPGTAGYETQEGVHIYRYPYFFKSSREKLADGAIMPNIKKNKLLMIQIPFLFLMCLIYTIKIISKHNISTIHAHRIFINGCIGAIYKKIINSKIKLICTSHGSDLHTLSGGIIDMIKKWTINQCDIVTVVSDYLKEQLNSLMGKETNPYIIPMGVDTTLFFPAEGVQEKNDEIKLLYIGRLSYEKGVIDMLHSVIYCVNNGLNISCKIIGDGPLFEEMQKIIATKKGTLNKIELLGSKQNIELREFYQQADYFLFPSTKESFGITAVESILCGTPVLWNKSLPSTGIIIDGLNGILVYFNDKYELYQKLNESHYFDTTHVVSSGKKFSWENSSKKYSDILKTL